MRALPGQAQGEGAFAGLVAPSGRGEPLDVRPVTIVDALPARDLDAERQARRAARYILGAAYRRHDAAYGSQRRRAVMLAARLAETQRRARLAADAAETPYEPLPLVGADATPDEYRGVPLRTITALAELTAPRWPVARTIAARFDRAVARLAAERHAWSALMSAEPTNEGRGNGEEGYAAGTVVNGRETRVSPRWTPTPRRAVKRENGSPIDWNTYSHYGAGGMRRLFVPAERETRRAPTARQLTVAERHAATVRGIVARGIGDHDYGSA